MSQESLTQTALLYLHWISQFLNYLQLDLTVYFLCTCLAYIKCESFVENVDEMLKDNFASVLKHRSSSLKPVNLLTELSLLTGAAVKWSKRTDKQQ